MNNSLLMFLALFHQAFLFSQNDIEKIILPDLKENNIYFNYADFLVDDSSYFFNLSIKNEYNSLDLSTIALSEEITNNDFGYKLFKVSSSISKKYIENEYLNDIKLYKANGYFISNISKYEIQLMIEKDGTYKYIAVFKLNNQPYSGTYFVSANISNNLPKVDVKSKGHNKSIKTEACNQLIGKKIIEQNKNNEKYMRWWATNEFNAETFVLAWAEDKDQTEKSVLYNYSTGEVIKETNFKKEGRVNYMTPLPCTYKGEQLFMANFSPLNSKQKTNVILYFDGNKYVFSENGTWIN